MQHAEVILDTTTIIVAFLAFVLAMLRGGPAYLAIFAGKKFNYKFNAERLPIIAGVTLLFALVAYVYCWLVAGDAAAALIYAIIMTFVVAVGSAVGLGYTPK